MCVYSCTFLPHTPHLPTFPCIAPFTGPIPSIACQVVPYTCLAHALVPTRVAPTLLTCLGRRTLPAFYLCPHSPCPCLLTPTPMPSHATCPACLPACLCLCLITAPASLPCLLLTTQEPWVLYLPTPGTTDLYYLPGCLAHTLYPLQPGTLYCTYLPSRPLVCLVWEQFTGTRCPLPYSPTPLCPLPPSAHALPSSPTPCYPIALPAFTMPPSTPHLYVPYPCTVPFAPFRSSFLPILLYTCIPIAFTVPLPRTCIHLHYLPLWNLTCCPMPAWDHFMLPAGAYPLPACWRDYTLPLCGFWFCLPCMWPERGTTGKAENNLNNKCQFSQTGLGTPTSLLPCLPAGNLPAYLPVGLLPSFPCLLPRILHCYYHPAFLVGDSLLPPCSKPSYVTLQPSQPAFCLPL